MQKLPCASEVPRYFYPTYCSQDVERALEEMWRCARQHLTAESPNAVTLAYEDDYLASV